MSQFSLKGLSVLVTGGLNGLGRATAKKLSELGSSVTIMDNATRQPTEPKLENCNYFNGDICVSDDVQECLDTIQKRNGRLDVLVTCAGISSSLSIFKKNTNTSVSLPHLQNVFRHNILSCFNAVRLAVPLIAANEPNSDGQRGVIILNSGTQAFDGGNMQTLGSAAAHAVVSMTLPLSRDLSSLGIRVVSIAPGIFNVPSSPANSKYGLMERILCASHLSRQKCGDVDYYASIVETCITNPMLNGCTIRVDDGYRLVF